MPIAILSRISLLCVIEELTQEQIVGSIYDHSIGKPGKTIPTMSARQRAGQVIWPWDGGKTTAYSFFETASAVKDAAALEPSTGTNACGFNAVLDRTRVSATRRATADYVAACWSRERACRTLELRENFVEGHHDGWVIAGRGATVQSVKVNGKGRQCDCRSNGGGGEAIVSSRGMCNE